MSAPNCRFFNGYKPCDKSSHCSERCSSFQRVETAILIVHLGALGAVLRSTALLAPIRRKYRNAHITWVTQSPADQLLKEISEIDRVLTTSQVDIFSLAAFEFDVGFVIDKSPAAVGISKIANVKKRFGFTTQEKSGGIIPLTESAAEVWNLGLDNHRKFFVNTKPETQLMVEALELGSYQRDNYQIALSDSEQILQLQRKEDWAKSSVVPVVGINTGCSATIPFKKLSIKATRDLVIALLGEGFVNIVLLGGREDTVRNREIAEGLPIVVSPTELGLRDGLVSVAACDMVLTGDSLGMHMAIALKKWVVAWFGPTCAHEIDLFDRGEKILSRVRCSPCWKRVCHEENMCYDQVEVSDWVTATLRGYQIWQKESLLFKQPSLETFY